MTESKIKGRTLIKKHYTANINVNASSYGYATATAFEMSTPSGYAPIAVVGFSSDSTCPVYTVSSNATGAQGALWVRNVTTATKSITVTLDVLYAPTDIVA